MVSINLGAGPNDHQSQKKFSLKYRDFASGRMLSPPRNEWAKCDCCGMPVVQGMELTNGDKIGLDCEELRWRIERATRYKIGVEGIYKMFRPRKYLDSLYSEKNA